MSNTFGSGKVTRLPNWLVSPNGRSVQMCMNDTCVRDDEDCNCLLTCSDCGNEYHWLQETCQYCALTSDDERCAGCGYLSCQCTVEE
jgi:hypothetical protein